MLDYCNNTPNQFTPATNKATLTCLVVPAVRGVRNGAARMSKKKEASTPTQKQIRRQAIIKELYVGIIGLAWMAASVAAIYYLVRAIFFGGSWFFFFGIAALAWVLYRVALYYELEKEHARREAAKAEVERSRLP